MNSTSNIIIDDNFDKARRQAVADIAAQPNRAELLIGAAKTEVLNFLSVRPVHTVAMASFIHDNGMESADNRGAFYGFRGANGALEGVALVGHATLIESRSEEALAAFASIARQSETPIHIIMLNGGAVEKFWKYYAVDNRSPRLICSELLFELSFPYFELGCDWDVRLAATGELAPVAEAHAEVAFLESGIDPLKKDPEGFLKRVLRRIEQKRVFVVFKGDELIFKADVVAETAEVIYLEGIFVAPKFRGQGIASSCLSKLSAELLCRAEHICLLSNVELKNAHRSFLKAGFKNTDCSATIFV